jgi:tRNA-specific 2-thiouridylase
MMKQRVLLGMSGGIDSSVAAMLLKEQGFNIVGVTFRTFDSIRESCLAKEKGCCSVDSIMEAKHLAEQLDIPHHILDFRDTFRDMVIANFVDEYRAGRTPNPCVLCNSHIKWGKMLQAAEQFDCDFIATGHYARIAEQQGHYFLRRAADTRKDQTYFLWTLTEDNLLRTIFPLGDYTKQQVREIAAQHGFVKLSQKTESQEICFVPNNDYRTFLAAEGVKTEPGAYIDADGKVIGQHGGYTNYTIGQRKGLGVALGTPAFVTHINPELNQVTLGAHDDLYTHTVRFRNGFFRGNPEQPVMAQIRYRSLPAEARLIPSDEPNLNVLQFIEPVWAVTPGQSAVCYQNDLLIGGGFIE